MNSLDDKSVLEKYDLGHTLESVSRFPDQCQSAWRQARKISLPDAFRTFSQIVFLGMGGSAYGARLVKSLYGKSMKAPIDLVGDYTLPEYVGKDSLVVAASYSGTTEETIETTRQAIARGAKVMGVTSGGELADVLKSAGCPAYVFDAVYNPSRQPRIGQGYMLLGQLALLAAAGAVSVSDDEIAGIVSRLRTAATPYAPQTPQSDNPAKRLAVSFGEKIVIIIGAGFLEGAIHAIRNPFHETGKHYADYYIVPELNHHLMEGLKYPPTNRDTMIFFAVESDLYEPLLKRRMELTGQVIGENGIAMEKVKLSFPTALGQSLELVQLGGFLTFYLAMLHGLDPAKIPWVDYFKKHLHDNDRLGKSGT